MPLVLDNGIIQGERGISFLSLNPIGIPLQGQVGKFGKVYYI